MIKNKIKFLIFISIIALKQSIKTSPITISETPICFFNDKILNNKKYRPFLIGQRYRYSTTGAVSWFTKNNSNFLVTGNFSDHKINLLQFDEKNNTIKLIQKIENINGHPELSDISNKEKLYAISCSPQNIYIYKILENTYLKLYKHFFLNDAGYIHGISFSPDTKFLACTFIGKNENQYIKIYELEYNKNSKLNIKQKFLMKNSYVPLSPKTIRFSPNGKFIAISYALFCGTECNKDLGALAIYEFDNTKGTLSNTPIFFSDSLELSNPDDLAFYPDGSHIFISNQGNDKVYIFEFDQDTGQLGKNVFTLSNTAAEISFPHGIAISHDGKYLAVTNYGTDTTNIYSITK